MRLDRGLLLYLDDYEARNLLWLLREINADAEWARAFNTGDWLGQIMWKLEHDHGHAVDLQANASAGEARKRS